MHWPADIHFDTEVRPGWPVALPASLVFVSISPLSLPLIQDLLALQCKTSPTPTVNTDIPNSLGLAATEKIFGD